MNSKIINSLFLTIFTSCLFFGCKEIDSETTIDPPKQIISVEQAREMYDAYSQRRVPLIQKYEDSISSDSTKFTPTRYAEYDFEAIKQYIAYIEQEAKDADIQISTLRFYLSNYPDGEKFGDGNDIKYPRRNTFFVVPTMAYQGNNVGFYLEDSRGKYTARPIRSYKVQGNDEQNKTQADSTGQMNEAGFFISNNSVNQAGGTTSVILNDSSITPPPGTDDFGNN